VVKGLCNCLRHPLQSKFALSRGLHNFGMRHP